MHSMLIVLNEPDAGHMQAQQEWRAFIGYVQNRLQPYTNAERLGSNAWLVNMRTDPLPFALLVAAAHEHSIGYRILAFDDEPQWLPAP